MNSKNLNSIFFGENSDEVPYFELCSCNPKNGGSGICNCTVANRMVKKNNVITKTGIDIDYSEYHLSRKQEKASHIVENNKKINILSTLIQIIESEHPEFLEENTTGWDLIENAKEWLEELKK